MIDNYNDGCGFMGFGCIYLDDGILLLNKIASNLADIYSPAGTITFVDEMMVQTFVKKNNTESVDSMKLLLDAKISVIERLVKQLASVQSVGKKSKRSVKQKSKKD